MENSDKRFRLVFFILLFILVFSIFSCGLMSVSNLSNKLQATYWYIPTIVDYSDLSDYLDVEYAGMDYKNNKNEWLIPFSAGLYIDDQDYYREYVLMHTYSESNALLFFFNNDLDVSNIVKQDLDIVKDKFWEVSNVLIDKNIINFTNNCYIISALNGVPLSYSFLSRKKEYDSYYKNMKSFIKGLSSSKPEFGFEYNEELYDRSLEIYLNNSGLPKFKFPIIGSVEPETYFFDMNMFVSNNSASGADWFFFKLYPFSFYSNGEYANDEFKDIFNTFIQIAGYSYKRKEGNEDDSLSFINNMFKNNPQDKLEFIDSENEYGLLNFINNGDEGSSKIRAIDLFNKSGSPCEDNFGTVFKDLDLVDNINPKERSVFSLVSFNPFLGYAEKAGDDRPLYILVTTSALARFPKVSNKDETIFKETFIYSLLEFDSVENIKKLDYNKSLFSNADSVTNFTWTHSDKDLKNVGFVRLLPFQNTEKGIVFVYDQYLISPKNKKYLSFIHFDLESKSFNLNDKGKYEVFLTGDYSYDKNYVVETGFPFETKGVESHLTAPEWYANTIWGYVYGLVNATENRAVYNRNLYFKNFDNSKLEWVYELKSGESPSNTSLSQLGDYVYDLPPSQNDSPVFANKDGLHDNNLTFLKKQETYIYFSRDSKYYYYFDFRRNRLIKGVTGW